MPSGDDITFIDRSRLVWYPNKPSSLLGQGSFGIVFRGTWNGAPVAIKIIKPQSNHLSEDSRAAENAAVKQHHREIHRLRVVQNPYIIQYLNVFRDKDPRDLYIVTEFLEGGSLHDGLVKARARAAIITERTFLRLALCMAYGLCHVHNQSYTHGDMKPQNVLLTDPFVFDQINDDQWNAKLPSSAKAKIADFGLSRRLEGAARTPFSQSTTATADFGTGPCGTFLYMSPEAYNGVSSLSDEQAKASDVYAYALILFEMLSGVQSWSLEHVQNPMQLHLFVKEGRRPSWGGNRENIKDEYVSLVERCWAHEPSNRPTFDDIVVELLAIEERLIDGENTGGAAAAIEEHGKYGEGYKFVEEVEIPNGNPHPNNESSSLKDSFMCEEVGQPDSQFEHSLIRKVKSMRLTDSETAKATQKRRIRNSAVGRAPEDNLAPESPTKRKYPPGTTRDYSSGPGYANLPSTGGIHQNNSNPELDLPVSQAPQFQAPRPGQIEDSIVTGFPVMRVQSVSVYPPTIEPLQLSQSGTRPGIMGTGSYAGDNGPVRPYRQRPDDMLTSWLNVGVEPHPYYNNHPNNNQMPAPHSSSSTQALHATSHHGHPGSRFSSGAEYGSGIQMTAMNQRLRPQENMSINTGYYANNGGVYPAAHRPVYGGERNVGATVLKHGHFERPERDYACPYRYDEQALQELSEDDALGSNPFALSTIPQAAVFPNSSTGFNPIGRPPTATDSLRRNTAGEFSGHTWGQRGYTTTETSNVRYSTGTMQSTANEDVSGILIVLQGTNGPLQIQRLWREGHQKSVAAGLARAHLLCGAENLKLVCDLLKETPQIRFMKTIIARDLCTCIGNIARNMSGKLTENDVVEASREVVCTMFNVHHVVKQKNDEGVNTFAACNFALANLMRRHNKIEEITLRREIARWIHFSIGWNTCINDTPSGPFSIELGYASACAARNFIWMNEENLRSFEQPYGLYRVLCWSLRFFDWILNRQSIQVVESTISVFAIVACSKEDRKEYLNGEVLKLMMNCLKKHSKEGKIVRLIFSTIAGLFCQDGIEEEEEVKRVVDELLNEGCDVFEKMMYGLEDGWRSVMNMKGCSKVIEVVFRGLLSIVKFSDGLRLRLVELGAARLILEIASYGLTKSPSSTRGGHEHNGDIYFVEDDSASKSHVAMCELLVELCKEKKAALYLLDHRIVEVLGRLDRNCGDEDIQGPLRQVSKRLQDVLEVG